MSVGTAEHYKAGRRKPPTPVLRLFRIYRDGKALGPDWDGYKIVGKKLFGPNGKGLTVRHILLVEILWQTLAELDNQKYHQLLKSAAGEMVAYDA